MKFIKCKLTMNKHLAIIHLWRIGKWWMKSGINLHRKNKKRFHPSSKFQQNGWNFKKGWNFWIQSFFKIPSLLLRNQFSTRKPKLILKKAGILKLHPFSKFQPKVPITTLLVTALQKINTKCSSFYSLHQQKLAPWSKRISEVWYLFYAPWS
jgi:hypothetical protein